MDTHIRTYAYIYAHTHIYTHIYIHTYAHIYTYTYILQITYIYTNTFTLTHFLLHKLSSLNVLDHSTSEPCSTAMQTWVESVMASTDSEANSTSAEKAADAGCICVFMYTTL